MYLDENLQKKFMKMSRVCLVGVQGPVQLYAGLIAMEWYGLEKYGTTYAEAVLILYDFLVAPEQEEHIVEAIMQVAPVIKWKKIVFIGGTEMHNITLNEPDTSVAKFREKIGSYEFDEIIIARNHIGLGSDLILRSYPKATRLTYGDGFGAVGTEIFTSIYGANYSILYGRLMRLAKKIFSGKIGFSDLYSRMNEFIRNKFRSKMQPHLPFDAAVLILPIDYSGTYLNHLPLYVPSREHVINVLNKINRVMPQLNEYCMDLVKNVSNDCYLYLFVTATESGSTSLNNEVAMYIETIYENSPKGSTIFIKLHPRKNMSFGDHLLPVLMKDYNVIIINKGQFKSIPIEFWKPLIERCKIISFSSSSLSLKYIYGKDVVSGLSVEKIKKYIFKKYQKVVENDYYLVSEASDALETWDGSSPLWKRKQNSRTGQN